MSVVRNATSSVFPNFATRPHARTAADDSRMMSPRLGDDPATLAELFGLLVECPRHGGNPAHCDLRHIRQLALQDRFEWAKGLDLAEAQRIRAACAPCMRQPKTDWGLEQPQPRD